MFSFQELLVMPVGSKDLIGIMLLEHNGVSSVINGQVLSMFISLASSTSFC